MKEYLKPEDIARKLDVSPHTVYKWLGQGELKGLKAGALWRIRPRDLEEFLETGAKRAVREND